MADLLVVAGDATTDVLALRHVRTVWQAGRRVAMVFGDIMDCGGGDLAGRVG